MASVVEISNSALQKLGATHITSMDQNHQNARSCKLAYDLHLPAELRSHRWNFAIERVQLSANPSTPNFGRQYSFDLPTDYLLLCEDYEELNTLEKDWVFEGRSILTNFAAPLNLRYIKLVTDPNRMDILFREALATKMAIQMCEEITQTATKKDRLEGEYDRVIARARRANAIERRALVPPESSFITCRR